jgi:hypothetical protein
MVSNNVEILSYMNAISTGVDLFIPLFILIRVQVILSAAFTHLLPDAMETLKMYTYPVACASALGGFLVLIVVETVLTFHTIEDEHRVDLDCSSPRIIFR